MKPNHIKFLERLISLAQSELNMATQCRNLERVDLLTKRIAEYQDKIASHEMGRVGK